MDPRKTAALFQVCRRWGGYLFAALLISMIFHSELLSRMSARETVKVGAPLLGPSTDLGDNYVYYTFAKSGFQACFQDAGEGVKERGSQIACTYPGGLLVSHLIYQVASIVSSSPRWEVALTLILHTALLVLSVIVVIERLGAIGRWSRSLTIVLAVGFVFFLGNFALSFYLGFPYKYFAALYGAEPDIMRIMNPTIFWALGLFSLAAFVEMIVRPGRLSLALCALSVVLLGSASIAMAGALLFGLGLFLATDWLALRKLDLRVLGCVAILCLGIAFTIWMFRLYWTSETGEALKHGQFQALVWKQSFLWLLIPLACGRLSRDDRVNRLLKCVLFASLLIGMFCDSLQLGGRLWLRGATIFALLCVTAWMMEWLCRVPFLRNGTFSDSRKRKIFWVLSLAVTASLFYTMRTVRPWQPDMWRGYMSQDKYEALCWLETHAEGQTVVSTDIDDSYLIPFYTHSRILTPIYGLTGVSLEEGLRRYFFSLSLLADGDAYMQRLFRTKDIDIENHFRFLGGKVAEPYDYPLFQAVAFYEALLYYPYHQRFQNVLIDVVSQGKFENSMRVLWKMGAAHDYRFSYLLIRRQDELARPSAFVEVFANASYSIYKPLNGRESSK